MNDFAPRLDSSNKDIKKLTDSIGKKITAIEEALYQTKAKSGQDVLNYPIRLNDKLSGLYDFAASGYNPPSRQALETYTDLTGQVNKHLDALKKVMDVDLKELNRLIHLKEVPVIGIKK
jgi:hypothetical protein